MKQVGAAGLMLALAVAAYGDLHQSVGSGNWSSAATWSPASVPADGDTVQVMSGHTVTFDANENSMTNGTYLSVSAGGKVAVSRTAGTYIKKAGGWTIAGEFECGTPASPQPYDAKFTWVSGQAYAGVYEGSISLVAYQPTYLFCRLTSDALSTDNHIHIDTDVFGAANPWHDGDQVCIVTRDGATKALKTETSHTSNSITFTATLGSAFSTGDYAVLYTRSVKLQSTYVGAYSPVLGSAVVSGTWTAAAWNATYLPKGITVLESLFYAGTGASTAYVERGFALRIADSFVLGTLDASASGYDYVPGSTYISDSVVTGGIKGNLWPEYTVAEDCVIHGTVSPGALLRNCLVTASTEFGAGGYCLSTDHDQTAGALKIVSWGGTVVDESSTVQAGYSKSYKMTVTAKWAPALMVHFYTVTPGETLRIRGWARKGFAEADEMYRPSVWFVKDGSWGFDPLNQMHHRSSHPLVLQNWTMTDTTDTWESFDLSWANTSAWSVQVAVYCSTYDNTNGSGVVYWQFDRVFNREAW